MQFDTAKEVASAVFAHTYIEAREKFRTATRGSRAYACSTKGPGGEELTTDVAYFGGAQANKLLVVISATHGPEGYGGSAAQLTLLEAKLHERLPASTAVLLIHALNCYGFAWDRRVTAEGCDLNRNFIDFSQPIPSNAPYEELADHFLPEDFSDEGMRRAEAAIQAYRAKHGEWKFQSARKCGQYTVPGGMFYGGSGPTEARRTLEAIAHDFNIATRQEVIIIDYHTGLGPYGYGELQCEQVSGIAGHERALRIFGPSATSPIDGTSASMALYGTQDEFWERLLGERHTYVCLEFGTYDADSARKAQRDDLWLFKYRPQEADAERGRRVRAATKSYFYPERLDWQEMVVWRSHQVHRQAIEALA
jgi:hypothetical protein